MKRLAKAFASMIVMSFDLIPTFDQVFRGFRRNSMSQRVGMYAAIVIMLPTLLAKEITVRLLRLYTSMGHAPGWGLRQFAQTCFSQKTYNNVLEPVLSDLQEEYFEAIAEEPLWWARWVRFRGYGSFWAAVAVHLVAALGRRVAKFWERRPG